MKICIGMFLSLFIMLATPAFAERLNNHSLTLDGDGDFASIADSYQTGLDGMQKLTIEAWVNFENLPTSGDHQSIVIKSRGGSWNWCSYMLYVYNTSGTYSVDFVPGSGSSTHNEFSFPWNAPAENTWYHIAVTFDGSNGDGVAYVNGVQIGSDSENAFSIGDTSEPVSIGAKEPNGTSFRFFDGQIDDVRIWNVVRTGLEINDYKNVVLRGDETGLVGYWRFNDNTDDETSNGNDLTLSGNAGYTSDYTPIMAP